MGKHNSGLWLLIPAALVYLLMRLGRFPNHDYNPWLLFVFLALALAYLMYRLWQKMFGP